MLDQLGGPSARTAAMAWSWLGERITPETVAQLAQIAVDPKAASGRRLDALRALELGKKIGPSVFETLFKDPSPAIRYQALRAAGELQLDADLFVRIFSKAPEDPNYRVRAALANAVRGHRKATPEMIALVTRLGRAPIETGGTWETYDREFERYLARWAMETHREPTLRMLESDFRTHPGEPPVSSPVARAGSGGRAAGGRAAIAFSPANGRRTFPARRPAWTSAGDGSGPGAAGG